MHLKLNVSERGLFWHFTAAAASSFGNEIIIQDRSLKVYKISIFSQALSVMWESCGKAHNRPMYLKKPVKHFILIKEYKIQSTVESIEKMNINVHTIPVKKLPSSSLSLAVKCYHLYSKILHLLGSSIQCFSFQLKILYIKDLYIFVRFFLGSFYLCCCC